VLHKIAQDDVVRGFLLFIDYCFSASLIHLFQEFTFASLCVRRDFREFQKKFGLQSRLPSPPLGQARDNSDLISKMESE
jgi:hypothetical protein